MGDAVAITTVSEPLAVDLRRHHPKTPVIVIENGVDLADIAGMSEPSANQRFTAIYTGNFFGRQSPAGSVRRARVARARDAGHRR